MKTIEIYDPAMCCPTGLCGPSIDPELSRIAADLEQLKKKGVEVNRYNLSQSAGAFAENPLVKKLLEDDGTAVLPVIIVDNEVYKKQAYPSREELEELFGPLPEKPRVKQNLLSEDIRELIAIGASIAANCEPCFRAHYKKAKDAGVTKEKMLEAVAVGDGVKKASASNILNLADRYLKDNKSLKMIGEEAEEDEEVTCCAPGSDNNNDGEACC